MCCSHNVCNDEPVVIDTIKSYGTLHGRIDTDSDFVLYGLQRHHLDGFEESDFLRSRVAFGVHGNVLESFTICDSVHDVKGVVKKRPRRDISRSVILCTESGSNDVWVWFLAVIPECYWMRKIPPALKGPVEIVKCV